MLTRARRGVKGGSVLPGRGSVSTPGHVQPEYADHGREIDHAGTLSIG
jgi:hypothetical protein